MNADLMGPSRLQPALHQRIMRQVFQHAEMRDRRFPRFRFHIPLHPIFHAPTERQPDNAVITGHFPVDEGHVFSLRPVRADLFLKRAVRLRRFGRHHHAGRIFVQAMHDARTGRVSRLKERRSHMMQQRIDERSVGISRSRMNHHAPRFIDHDHGFVLEKDIQRDILRDQFDGLRLLEGKLDDIQ